MDQSTHNKIVAFIRATADDVLRDLFKRGKYPDVISPCASFALSTPSWKPNNSLIPLAFTAQHAALCDAAKQVFYNTSRFTLRDLKSRASQQQLLADFEDYLNGFSANVQEIIENFKFRNQLSTLSKSDSLGTLIAKFLDPEIDLSPAGIDNHSMGTVFEELVRKFNEDNNEEAGEHWTPRDAVKLIANLSFLPIADNIESRSYLLYDGHMTSPVAPAACSPSPRKPSKASQTSATNKSSPICTARKSTPKPSPSVKPTSSPKAKAKTPTTPELLGGQQSQARQASRKRK
jgi:type I restriction enzyme M protein